MPSDNTPHNNNPPSSASPPAPSPAESVSYGSTSGRKRRTSTTGSRGVANLTPDQLAKKRANDREAQRAIRERTKNQIDSLERTIRELRSQQPYQDLQRVIRQKEAVEAENAEIKRRLASVLSILQPLIGAGGQGEIQQYDHFTLGSRSNVVIDIITPPYRETLPLHSSLSPPADVVSATNHRISAITPSYAEASVSQSTPINTSSSSITPRAWATQAQAPPLGGLTVSSPGVYGAEHPAVDRHRDAPHHGLTSFGMAQRHDFAFSPETRPDIQHGRPQVDGDKITPALPANSHITLAATGAHGLTRARSIHNGQEIPIPAYLARPTHIPATCPLDGLLLEFFRERSQYAAAGHSEADLIGPAYPAFCCAFRPERGIYTHPLSRFLTDILSTFPDLAEPPVKVAVLYIMFLLIRWHICPNRENYERLPDWMKPSHTQVYTPHPAWLDSLPFPKMRDKICLMENPVPLDIFFIPFTRTLSLNWPFEPMEVVLQGQLPDELVLNPAFERHLRDPNNWTLGPAFARAFPELVETARIKDEGEVNSG